MTTPTQATATVDIVRAAVDQLEHQGTFLVALAANADGTDSLMVQMALAELDEQDVQLGTDTYCLVAPDGATFYGGVQACVRDGDTLALHLSHQAAQTLGLAQHLRLRLRISEGQQDEVTTALRRIFTCGCEQPDPLSL